LTNVIGSKLAASVGAKQWMVLVSEDLVVWCLSIWCLWRFDVELTG